jgi:hypothetical protein
MRQYANVLLLVVVMLLAAGCNDEEDCSLNGRPMMTCNLFAEDLETGQMVKVALQELTITAAGTDSIILNKATNVSTLTLPLRYTSDSTQLVFDYGEEFGTDTLIITQSNTPYFLSMDCGYQMKQSITGRAYTRHQIDSIHVAQPQIDIYGTENLQIYFRQ